MSIISDPSIILIGDVLLNKDKPLKARFRALFSLKNIGGDVAIEMISECFNDDSDLLKHECAYCLGQMQDISAIPVLKRILNDTNQPIIVRHEAGEALGAIGDIESVEDLKINVEDVDQSVSIIKHKRNNFIRETCELALARIDWQQNKGELENTTATRNPYNSVDPTPPSSVSDVDKLGSTLCDISASLYDRYCAMFSLRNIGSEEAILHLSEGLKCLDSALFRHEVAYVLGQAQHRAAVDALTVCLADGEENPMVRHECAEALGAIATEKCQDALQQFSKSSVRIVRESCEVALDMCEYECDGMFQYANTLSSTMKS